MNWRIEFCDDQKHNVIYKKYILWALLCRYCILFEVLCLSSLPLNMSKTSEGIIIPIIDCQSVVLLWLNAYLLSSYANQGMNSSMLWFVAPLYCTRVHYLLEYIRSISFSCFICHQFSMVTYKPLYSMEYKFKLWSHSWYDLSLN